MIAIGSILTRVDHNFPGGLGDGLALTSLRLGGAKWCDNKTKISHTPFYLDSRVFQASYYQNHSGLTSSSFSAIIQINPDLFAIASQRDAERKAGKVRGPLHGIPFIVKDNIASKDNLETCSGSWALLGNIVPRDAFVVKKLRDAGAVLFGKAALSEWADMRSNNYSEGYSGRGGQARSAYNLTVNPGGSSTGSGVGVGANVIAFALGTETDGSGE